MIPKKWNARLWIRISTAFDSIRSRNLEPTAIVGTFYVLAPHPFNTSTYHRCKKERR
ncbi:hypothetical protein J42TS3_45170 [Paenibacillus vini]|uniref:Uncharacterized protein n=1 Tax=Paenibacillus vini TaxID=1476024 RepID=A0ABQ4MIL4_9BACL|nr:hypothetical protein J42TS3_45170 [Paenibacillus vini]